ncbi:hypothetical protein GCM10027404_32660 [Arthrobacter tumbae]
MGLLRIARLGNHLAVGWLPETNHPAFFTKNECVIPAEYHRFGSLRCGSNGYQVAG